MLSDQGMGAAAITAGIPVQESAPASVLPEKLAHKIDEWRERLAQTDWVPDLGRDIGSLTWFRGLATLTLLCGFALRSEEHTSELQSRPHLVCRLLLEKKNST